MLYPLAEVEVELDGITDTGEGSSYRSAASVSAVAH